MALAPGTRLGPYAITTPLGAGGMGEVYKATDTRLDRTVAMAPDVALAPPRLLFEQQYAFGTGITIPNYDVSPDGQRFVMVKDESGAGRLNVVLNWSEELNRLVPKN